MGSNAGRDKSLATEALRRLGADERLILRDDGNLILEEDGWGEVEIVELQEPLPPITIDLDLDDPCVLSVQDVFAQPVLPKRSTAPPHPPAAEAPRAVLRGQPVACVQLQSRPQAEAVRAMAAGDFAKAQRVLGHAPRHRVLTPRPTKK